jgi:hypothetical protein
MSGNLHYVHYTTVFKLNTKKVQGPTLSKQPGFPRQAANAFKQEIKDA